MRETDSARMGKNLENLEKEEKKPDELKITTITFTENLSCYVKFVLYIISLNSPYNPIYTERTKEGRHLIHGANGGRPGTWSHAV